MISNYLIYHVHSNCDWTGFVISKLPMLRMLAYGLRDIEDRLVFDPIRRRDRHMASPPRGSLLDD